MSPQTDAKVDGRRARRDRGRTAAATAVIDLVLEGHSPPSAEQVAERASISKASLFRYFSSLDELRDHSLAVYFDRYESLIEIPNIAKGPLTARARRYAAARVKLYAETEPMARLVRQRATEIPAAAGLLTNVRSTLSDQFTLQFESELRQLSAAAQRNTIAMGSMITSFESWDQLRSHHGRSTRQIEAAWADAIRLLLST